MPAHYATEWDTGAALVGAELGVALIPRLAHLPGGYPVVRVPLSGDPTPSRHLLTGIRRGSAENPVIATSLRSLEEVCQARLTSRGLMLRRAGDPSERSRG
jgi:ribosomal protein S12 methylthiotransferase accessory factor YcaO